METNRWFFGSLLIYCGLATPIRATADEAIQPLDETIRAWIRFQPEETV